VVVDNGDIGFWIRNTYASSITGNTIHMSSGGINGIALKGDATGSGDPNVEADQRNTVTGNTITGTGVGAIYILGHANYNTISANSVEGTFDYGIYHIGTEWNLLSNNVILSTTLNGIHSEGPAKIDNNFVKGCGRNGIYSKANDSTISGNICVNNSTSSAGTYNGITIDIRTRNVVSGNRCYDDQGVKTQGYGIAETGATDFNVISANQLQNNLTGGLLYVGANDQIGHNITA
jgi:parallel beta-helix repeat protein